MKKTIKLWALLLLVLVTVTALASCGGGNQTTEPPVNDVIEPEDKSSCKIVNNEVLAYDEQGTRINYNNEFFEHKGNTYYVVNNFVVTGFYIVDNNVYYFNEYGVKQNVNINEVFVEFNGSVYYSVNNTIVFNTVVINGAIYDFGDDGKMVTGAKGDYVYGEDGKLIANESFVTLNGDVYYVINNTIVYNMIIIDGAVYNFGDDGKMITGEYGDYFYGEDGRLLGDGLFVNIKGDVYYLIGDLIVYNQIIIDGFVYNFGDDGKMIVGEKDGYTYDADGKLVGDKLFIAINGDIYYIINNMIIYNEHIINGYVYNFGEDGKMIKGEYEGNVYGEDGRLVADKLFITINGDVYYIINNMIVYNMIIIDGCVYDFGYDGKMVTGAKGDLFFDEEGHLVADKMFITVNGNVYYIINNVIVINQIVVVDGFVYSFDENGKMITGEHDGYTYDENGRLVADEIFITINGDVYYIINNKIVYNQIIIDGFVYDFGDDGKMVIGSKGDLFFDEEGHLVADKVFITINGDVYYIINNMIVYNVIVIDGYVYDFGDDGKMVTGVKGNLFFDENGRLVADEVFVTINGNVYYFINNMIVINQIVVIDGFVYRFDENGHMITGEHNGYTYGSDGRLVADEIFITINGDVYYIINNTIVYNQIIIDGYVYNFGDDGKMITGTHGAYTYDENGRLLGDRVFITINGRVYYIINNVIVINVYIIHNGRVYYFTSTGERLENAEFDGYVFGADGYITNNSTIVINGVTYVITNGYVDELVEFTTIKGTVYESDNDFTIENNDKLANVVVRFEIGGEVYTTYTDANGYFEFVDIEHSGVGELSFALDGYYSVEMGVEGSREDLTIVMDRRVSNNLVGTVLIADADSTLTNNSPLAGALITLERTSSTNGLRYQTTTDYSGYYSFSGLTAGVYTLTVEKDGYIPVTQTVQVRYNETTVNNVAIEAIPDVNDADGYASGYITEALRGTGVEGLTVYIYEGINTTFGRPVEVLTTNASGYYATSALKPGNYTAHIVDERVLDDEAYRYSSVAISLKVLPGVTSANQNATVANSVGLDIDGMRIVLTWGSSPSDLDSHLTYGSYHVYYGHKWTPCANLDWDDTSAFGPETITITDMGNNTFTYYIYNYSRSGTMYASQACIRVYFGNSTTPAYTFYPPQGSGYYWDVFSYNAATGEFTILNTLR